MDSGVPAVGDLAPDFVLEDAGGNPRRMSELTAGRLVILIFYRGHW
jgi:peroxiredoxin